MARCRCLCVAAIAACGSSSSSSSASSSAAASTLDVGVGAASTRAPRRGADAAVAKLVPAAIKSKGTLTVAADATYAPNEFIGPDGHTVVGMDADLSNALAKVMGLKAKLVNATFDTIIPGLAAGKYDMGASSFSDNKEREKTVDFVDYFIAGESFITKASGGTSISSIGDICGKTRRRREGHHRGGRRRHAEQEVPRRRASRRSRSSRSPIRTRPTWPCRAAGRSSASSTRRSPSIRSSNRAGSSRSSARRMRPVRTASPCPRATSRPAVLAALKVVMQNGTYDSILKHWGLTSGAIPAAQVKINGAVS